MQNAVRLLVQVSIAILLVVCSSCNAYYQSNMQQVPLLQAKGDLVFNLGPKDLQCAYAVSDQIGLLANGQYRNHSWDLDSLYDSFGTEPGLINEFRRRSITRYGELAAGYFKQGGGSQLVFEFYAGVGLGKLEYEGDFSAAQKILNSDLNRVFLQPCFGIRRRSYELAFSTRFTSMSFAQLSHTNFSAEERKGELLRGIDNRAYLMLEPALTLRAGTPQVKLQAQAAYEAQLNNDPLGHTPFRLSLALNIRLNTAKKYED